MYTLGFFLVSAAAAGASQEISSKPRPPKLSGRAPLMMDIIADPAYALDLAIQADPRSLSDSTLPSIFDALTRAREYARSRSSSDPVRVPRSTHDKVVLFLVACMKERDRGGAGQRDAAGRALKDLFSQDLLSTGSISPSVLRDLAFEMSQGDASLIRRSEGRPPSLQDIISDPARAVEMAIDADPRSLSQKTLPSIFDGLIKAREIQSSRGQRAAIPSSTQEKVALFLVGCMKSRDRGGVGQLENATHAFRELIQRGILDTGRISRPTLKNLSYEMMQYEE
jgi:hypothetical protein